MQICHNCKKPFSLYKSPVYSHTSKALKPAFTLAEVLITLAIIGVVDPLTLASLIQNFKERQYV